MSSRAGSYSAMYGDGLPFLKGGQLDKAAIKAQARFPNVILDAQYLLQYPQVIDALRAANPQMKLHAYVQAGFCMSARGGYPLQIKNAVIATDGLVPDAFRPGGVAVEINLAKHETVIAVTQVIAENIIQSGKFDGIFLDSFEQIAFTHDPAFNASWTDGFKMFADRLRIAAPGFTIMGNYGPGGQYPGNVLNGWMRENFPRQNGQEGDSLALTWIANMVNNPWNQPGVMNEKYAAPMLSFLCWNPGSTTERAQQIMLFSLCSALLTDHCVASAWRAEWIKDEPYRTMWWPEYDVPLGAPLGPAVHDQLWRRDYEHAITLVNPTERSVSVYNLPRCHPPGGAVKTAWNVKAFSGMLLEKV